MKILNVLKISAVLFLAVQPLSFAGQYDLKQMTPEVSRAIENRKARYSQLQEAKAAGQIGENIQGLVTALNGGESLAAAENADRNVIYRAIIEQNGFAPQAITQVQQTFAAVQREKARSGDYIQTTGGQWVKK